MLLIGEHRAQCGRAGPTGQGREARGVDGGCPWGCWSPGAGRPPAGVSRPLRPESSSSSLGARGQQPGHCLAGGYRGAVDMGPRHGRLGSGPGLSLAGPTVPVRRIPQVVAAVSSCISVGLGLEVPRGLQPLAMMGGGEGASTLQDRWTPGPPRIRLCSDPRVSLAAASLFPDSGSETGLEMLLKTQQNTEV